MDFIPQDFEQLYSSIIKDSVTSITSKYFFNLGNKMIFIKKGKNNYYKVVATFACGFDPIYLESHFEVLFASKDITECINKFKMYVRDVVDVLPF